VCVTAPNFIKIGQTVAKICTAIRVYLLTVTIIKSLVTFLFASLRATAHDKKHADNDNGGHDQQCDYSRDYDDGHFGRQTAS